MNEMRIFENEQFGKVRIIEEDGKVLFCGTDVAVALGYTNPRKAVRDHTPHGTKRSIRVQTGKKADGTPAVQMVETLFIPEGDVYRLITRSKLPAAEQFESWVFDEVLPSIRKTGGYIAGENQMSDDELVARALLMLKKKLEARNLELDQARGEIKQKDAQIQRLAPKASYCDLVLQAKEAVPISLIAKDYGLSARALNAMLHDMRIQYKVDDMWLLYQPLTKKGYTKSVTYLTDSGVLAMRTLWTQKGRMFLYEKLKEKGVLPEIEQTENGNLPKGVIPFDGRACPAH